MKSSCKFVVAFAFASSFGFAGTPAFAQTTANGPYYATPSWDQTLPSNTRFIILSNFSSQAVLDRETGLVWQRSPIPITDLSLSIASGLCLNQTTGNRPGWRLPTVNELASLFDPSVNNGPPLPAGHPFSGLAPFSARFWSATPGLPPANGQYHMIGYESDIGGVFFRSNILANPSNDGSAWCVRGGLQAGAQ